MKKAARKATVLKVAKQDATGNDPRVFSNKWTPFYRYTKLENGLKQQTLTAFGTMRFNDRVGMFYEAPLALKNDFSDIPGVPSGTDKVGMGDIIFYSGEGGGLLEHSYYRSPAMLADYFLLLEGKKLGASNGRPLEPLGEYMWGIDDNYFK